MSLSLLPAGGRAAAPAPVPAPSGCSTPLTLTLLPGLHVPGNRGSLPPAPDIPAGPVVIHVPLYPGAAASALAMPHAQYGVPMSRYLKSASAEYEVPGGWTAASTWYRQAFAACGYSVGGEGSAGVKGRTVSIGVVFRDPRHPPLEVALAFTHGPSGKTLVLYVASTIALPPPAAVVPGSPNAVTILSYRQLDQGQLAAQTPNAYIVVRDEGSIRQLARHLNNLPPPQGVMSCPADNGSHDTLLFAYPDGHRVTVDIETTGCRSVRAGNKVGLALSDTALFRLLDTLLARPSAVHPALPFDARTLRLAARRAHTADGSASFLAWNPGGTEYVYLDRGALWVADRDNWWHRQVAPPPVAHGVFDPSGDFLYRPLVHGALGPLTVVAQGSRLQHYRYPVSWAPRTRIIGTQAGMGLPWSNGMVMCDMHVWFPQGGRLVGIDPHYRSDTYRPALRLPPLSPATRIAVSCDGSPAAVAAPSIGLEIRDMRSGKLVRRLHLPSAVTGLSWATDNRTLAYVTGGMSGQLGTVDARTGRHHTLVSLKGDAVEGMTWDPYAHTLVFGRLARTALTGELEVVNADGSGLHLLDRQGGALAAIPQWSSRGGVIGYTRETLVGGIRQQTNIWADYLSLPHSYPMSSGQKERSSGPA